MFFVVQQMVLERSYLKDKDVIYMTILTIKNILLPKIDIVKY